MYKPKVAVQARELTTAQSILQNQITRFGKHVFNEGSMVIPGASALDVNYPYLKLQAQFSSVNIDVTNFPAGTRIVGLTSGAIATVLETVVADAVDPNTLYIKYETGVSSNTATGTISSGTKVVSSLSLSVGTFTIGSLVSGTGIPANTYITAVGASTITLNNNSTTSGSRSLTITTSDTFSNGETIQTVGGSQVFNASLAASAASGFGSRATIQQGIYFTKGFFCIVLDQSILLDKYSNTPSYNIGLSVVDSFVTSVQDNSLLDPAAGFSNFNAPGADRYKIVLTLSKLPLNTTPGANFITIIQVKSGVIQTMVTRPSYSELEKTLARRTYDSDGDFVTKNFPIQIRENLNTGTNNGLYTATAGGDETQLVGILEPGKAYVQGFEIETQQNTLLNIPKARTTKTYSNYIQAYDFGNYTDVNNLTGALGISTFETLSLYNSIGTGCTINVTTTGSGPYVVSVAAVNAGGSGYSVGDRLEIAGTGTKAIITVATLSGSAVATVTITSAGSYSVNPAASGVATTHSKVGTAKVRGMTYISGTVGTTAAVYRLNLFDVVMTFGNFTAVKQLTYANGTANTVLVAGLASLNDVNLDIAILKIPEYAISSVSGEEYIVRRYFTGVQSTHDLVLTAGTNELFEAGTGGFTNVNYVVTNNSGGTVYDMTAGGNSITLQGSPTGKQVKITVGSLSGNTLNVIATVKKTVGARKTKTLTTVTESGLTHGSTVQLAHADVYTVTSITDDGASGADITKRYNFDNGQRDNYYDRGSLVYNSNYAAPVGTITVHYQYFAHGTGDYFSVDSYSGVIPYSNVPIYVSTTDGTAYDLHNCIDFRPRIADAGGSFSVTSEFSAPGEDFSANYNYYVGRIDKIFLDSAGEFHVLSGVSDISPLPPKDPKNGMVLYQLTIPPYTFLTQDVVIKAIDNRNYTKRDIGKLDKRIGNLEYYTQLSLLEKSTESFFIDDGTGQNRFKNGFLVDNFSSHKIGNVGAIDYQCAMDTQNGYLVPKFSSDNISTVLNTGASSNYTQTGDLITLPYTHVSMAAQLLASTYENINPYDIYNWVGNVTLSPSSDDWYDTTFTPDQTIENDDGTANALAATNGQVIWNDWETNWLGKVISSTPVASSLTAAGIVASGATTGWDQLHQAQSGLAAFQSKYGRIPNSITGTFIAGTSPVNAFGITGATGVYQNLVSQQMGQTRTGIQYTVTPTTTTQVIDSKILDSSVIPYMRSNTILFSATRMKPNTRVYPFFDGTDVSAYCKSDRSGAVLGDPIITDQNGNVSGTFDLPDSTSSLRFRTGTRVFRLIDDSTNNAGTADTSADAIYEATGILQTEQNTILSTKTTTVVQNTVSQSRTIVGTNIQTTTDFIRWSDPLAQTFLVNQAGGVFLSKINIYFNSKDAGNTPVTLQLRNVVNGYPGPNIVPMSEVTLNPSSVNVSADASASTTFTFPSPVYLNDGQEYCFVLLANSDAYTVWVAKMGELDIASNQAISKQPYAGVMFKSQNASTWTAAQDEDIKFEIFRCSFNTGVTGEAVFNNDNVNTVTLSQDPFSTTNTSNVVKVFHANHGLLNGQKTTIAGVVGTQNNIPNTELNGQHTITYVDFDHYTFTSTTNANKTGSCGGATITATQNRRMDVANIAAQVLNFPATGISASIKTTDENNTLGSTYSNIPLQTNIGFPISQLITSTENGTNSMFLKMELTSTSENISPVIDTARLSIIAVSSRINADSTNETAANSGNAMARYITKQVSLASNCNSVTVAFSAIRPPNTDIQVYVKTLPVDTNVSFGSQSYALLNQVDYPSADASALLDYTFQIDNLALFDTFAIKVVMLSSDTALIPSLKDFRAMCTDN